MSDKSKKILACLGAGARGSLVSWGVFSSEALLFLFLRVVFQTSAPSTDLSLMPWKVILRSEPLAVLYTSFRGKRPSTTADPMV